MKMGLLSDIVVSAHPVCNSRRVYGVLRKKFVGWRLSDASLHQVE